MVTFPPSSLRQGVTAEDYEGEDAQRQHSKWVDWRHPEGSRPQRGEVCIRSFYAAGMTLTPHMTC